MAQLNRIIRQATEKDMPMIPDTIYQIWLAGNGGDEADAREVSGGLCYYYNFPEYPPESIAVAEVDGKIVSLAAVIPFPIQKDDFYVKAAQLNPVGTMREYQNQGLASGCIEFLCDLLRKQGYSVFFVCGLPGFYPRLGFYPVMDGFSGSIKPNNLKNLQTEAQIQQARMEDAEEILRIYQNSPGNNLLSVHRDKQWIQRKILDWERGSLPLGTIHIEDLALSTKDGRCGGYALVKKWKNAVSIEEIRAVDREHLLSLLKAAGETATSRGIEEIGINHTIPGEPLYLLIPDLGGRISVSKYSHQMLKILSVESLFTSMQQTFQKRIAQSGWDGKAFSLTVESHDEKVTFTNGKELRIFSGDPRSNTESSIKISSEGLTHLFAGHRTIHELIENGNCPDYGEIINSILHALFPKQYPYVYEADLN